jgi:hypothetical protein
MAKLGLVFAIVLLGACKQGVGDRCEVNDDCESGLVCSTGQDKTCFNPSQGGPDAPVNTGPDARVITITDAPIILTDAPPADAPGAADAGGSD